MVVCLIWISSL